MASSTAAVSDVRNPFSAVRHESGGAGSNGAVDQRRLTELAYNNRKKSSPRGPSLRRYQPDTRETFLGRGGEKFSIVRLTTFPPRRHSAGFIAPVRGQRKQWRRAATEVRD